MPESRSQTIDREMMTWPGVAKQPHRFGGTEYLLGGREIGHVHGESLVDVPLPRNLREALIRQGKARPHHILPESGWVSVPLRTMADVGKALEALRLSYDKAVEQRRQRAGRAPVAGA